MVRVTHRKVSGKSQGSDPTRVYGNHWDEDHVVEGLDVGTDVQAHDATLDQLSGRSLSGEGAIVLGDSATLNAPQINSPTGMTRNDVGLGHVDNTSDADKPVSNAAQSALDALESATQTALTGKQPIDADLTAIAALSGTGVVRRTGVDAWSAGTAVANSELATMATGTFKGNVSGSISAPSDLTAAQVTSALSVVTTSAKGLAPQLPNDATKFLDGTGNYSAPTGTGGNFIQDGIGAVTRTIQDKAREWVSILDFGAVGDGDIANASTNATALRNALAVGKSVRIPWTVDGYHFGAETIEVGAGQFVRGESSVLIKSSATTELFRMTGNDDINNQWNGIQGMTVDMSDTDSATSCAIRFATNDTVCSRNLLRKLTFTNCYSAIGADDGALLYTYYQVIEDIKCNYPRGTQIDMPLTRGFIYLNRVDIDNTLPGTELVTWTSIHFANYIGLYLQDVTVTGQNLDSFSPAPGFQVKAIGIRCEGNLSSGYRHIWANRVRCEASAGHGIQILNTTFFQGTDIEGFACLGLPVYFNTIDLLQIGSVAARGGADFEDTPAGTHGVTFTGVTKGTISNLRSSTCTGSGVLVNNSSNLQISNLYTEVSGAFGLLESGTSDSNSFGTLHSVGDTAPYSLVGKNTAINHVVVNGVRQVSPQSFMVNKGGAAQAAVPSATFAKITFSSEVSDPRGMFASDRVTPTRGLWMLAATVTVSNANMVDGSECQIAFFKNGTVWRQKIYKLAAPSAITLDITADDNPNGTDYYEVFVYIAGAGDKTISGGSSQTWFQGRAI